MAMLDRDIHASHRISPEITSQIRHEDVTRLLGELRDLRPAAMKITELGRSFEGRSISVVTLGTGPAAVFAWSQMHGDEPTHTAVLLDLISFLQRSPDHPKAESILAGCTLKFIIMLNPDGAARYTRRNAQGIDINRDALQLQTPEGRLLKQAIETIRPQFALNLHNQSQRACMGAHPARIAAVSLLVPPVDPADTQTAEVRQAKQLAGCFIDATRAQCGEMTSRYNAGFMPRCFGEWVQGQNIPTLTIEAGGWTGPTIEHSPLVGVHFLGLLSIVQSIAEGSYAQVDPAIYDALPVNNERRLLDMVIRDVRIGRANQRLHERGDIGVNFEAMSSDHRLPLRGSIADVGSLSETTGKSEIDGTDLFCLPGRIEVAPQVTPPSLPDADCASALLSRGVTTVIGTINLADDDALAAWASLSPHLPTPFHVGFLGDVAAILELPLQESQERLVRGISLGMLGVVAAALPPKLSRVLEWFDLATVSAPALTRAEDAILSVEEWLAESSRHAEQLNVSGGAEVALGESADLVLVNGNEHPPDLPIEWSNLRQVIVAGNVVFNDGKLQMDQGGSLLASDRGHKSNRRV